ncbi:hypothetical protein [Helicobacter sp. MIT 14-3879]|uniref:hypothetical protein n=1 Tax=Helicobacter sp. MIT 14-3879 TaxID=2040649 RepID=UPI000E1F77AF|nr:hypothetical protein [Helicobacter sp. MIT 14-3879]RDU65566.1 hypothetical protein CQA44_00885 [Helicobacter sp. MIT 14-3879]
MNDKQLKRKINSVGMQFFVTYFEMIRDCNDNKYLIEEINKDTMTRINFIYGKQSLRTKINVTRYILKNNLLKNVLIKISSSKNIPYAYSSKAKELLKKYKD